VAEPRKFLLILAVALAAPVAHGADIAKGSQLYALHCASCHGANGAGVVPGTPKMNRGEGMLQSDFAILATLKRGKNAMPPYGGLLRDRELLDVIAYTRTLQR